MSLISPNSVSEDTYQNQGVITKDYKNLIKKEIINFEAEEVIRLLCALDLFCGLLTEVQLLPGSCSFLLSLLLPVE